MISVRPRFWRLVLAALVICPVPAIADTTFEGYIVGEVMHNADGGIRSGSAFLVDAGAIVTSELDGLFGDVRAEVFAYFLWNNSATFSDRYVGDLQVASNIDAEQALRLYEFWYEQRLNDDVSMRIGLYDLNSEFDAIATAGLFMNSSHGIGAEYAQSGRAGPSIFPVTSLAARFDLALTESSLVRYAILDGVPGDPNDPSKTKIDLGGGDGVLHALEYNYQTDGGTRFGIGGWLYSADFDLIDPTPTRTRDKGNGGVYGFVDTSVWTSDSGAGATAFLRYGVANEDLNVFDSYLGGGVVTTGVFADRPEDQLGLAFASARTGSPFRRIAGNADSHETTIELTYSAQITDWLRLQPDLQYIVNPGANPALDDAWVIGLRFEVGSSYAIAHRWRHAPGAE